MANHGNLASGPFRVSGGGLGVPSRPYRDEPALGDGASREACLKYPTTPGPGTYRLGVTVDSENAVTETREDNNTHTIPVTVGP